ncbi:MAG: hypothetical protein HQM15_00035 [Deltaproteobacteria bacterium]|nr:hypothetical protein [Deltaproteobacteria bacterium]
MVHRSSVKKKLALGEGLEDCHKLRFDPEHLIKELVSLGSPKITAGVAKRIALEVGKKLQMKGLPTSPETISELVGEELAHLQFFEQEAPKASVQKIQTEKAQKMIAPFSPEAAEPGREVARLVPKLPPLKDTPWNKEKLKQLYEEKEWEKEKDFSELLTKEGLFSVCQALALIDSDYSSEPHSHPAEKLGHDFHNLIASEDFIPGSFFFHPDFLKHRKATGRLELSSPEGLNPFEVLESIYALKKQSFNSQLCFPLDAGNFNWDLFLKLLEIRQEQEKEEKSSFDPQDFFVLLGETSEKAKDRLQSLLSGKIKMNPSFGMSGSLITLSSPEHSEYGDISMLHQTLSVHSSLKLFFLEQKPVVNLSQCSASSSPAYPKTQGGSSEKNVLQGRVLPYGYINLSQMIKEEEVDWDRLRKNTRLAIHFLDNLLDFWIYPNSEIERATKIERKLALGFMGWMDLLYTLRIPYESDEAFCLASQIARLIEEESILASVQLAKDRGVYPNYEGSNWEAKSFPVRNAGLTQLIEDDFITRLSELTLGINLYPTLVTLQSFDENLIINWIHPFLAQVAKFRGIAQDSLLTKIGQQKSLLHLEEIPEDIQKVFVSQKDISWKNQILMAKEFERHFAGGVIQTINADELSPAELQEVITYCEEQGLQSLKLERTTPLKIEEPEEKPETEELCLIESFAEKTEPEFITEPDLTTDTTVLEPPLEAAFPLVEETSEPDDEVKDTVCETQIPLAEVLQLLPPLPPLSRVETEMLKTEKVNPEEEPPILSIFEIPSDVMTGLRFEKEMPSALTPPLEVMTGLSGEEEKKEEEGGEEELTEVIALHNLPEDHASSEEEEGREEEEYESNEEWRPRTRPNQLTGKTYTYTTCCGKLWITLNHDEEGIFEALTHLEASHPNCSAAQHTLINRFISLLFQAGVVTEEILAQLSGLNCCGPSYKNPQTLNCFEALSHAIRSHLEEFEGEDEEDWQQSRWQTLEESEWKIEF